MPHSALPPGFMVIHGNQPELLRQLLVYWMKNHPLDPLENEVILVQSNGVAQWLKQALAADPTEGMNGGCGIAAALHITLPSRFIWQTYRTVLGADLPLTSPFDKPLLTWRLMRLLPALSKTLGFEPLQRFLDKDDDLRKRYQLAERLSDLFDQYQMYRADWLAAWAKGQAVMPDHHGQSRPLPAEQIWQALLWQALQADVGSDADSSRAAVHQRFLQAAAELPVRPAGLPRRVIVFGLSALPEQSLEVLQAVSRFSQVLLGVNNPCQHYWANILSEKDYFRSRGRHRPKPGLPAQTAPEQLHLFAHPLLAAWGKQGRDYIGLLEELDNPEQYQNLFAEQGQRIDLFESYGEDCLLNQLQDDILQLRPVAESRELWPALDAEQDQSLRFHVAHGPQREVEVLHDQLLAAFDADASLKPREIIVMVPDINQYAPHIQAVFGQLEPNDPRYIPFAIADLGQRQQAPLAFALECLLNLGESRLPVSEMLDLLSVPALRQRFGINESDLPLLQHWINQANIRWGLDQQHRQGLGLDWTDNQNSWLFGLKRMLLGYAVGADPSGRQAQDWHDIEPYADIAGLDAALAGPLAQLLHQMQALLGELSQPAPPEVWLQRLQQLLADFFIASDETDSYLLLQLRNALEQWLEACNDAGLNEDLPLAVVRDFWLSQIDQGGLSQRFFAGNLTFATLMPMRAIPFRRIYLLGMNDGDYPRSHTGSDFDLMARDYRPGDRSRREDDRYLFLEALLSAREHLHISWVGRSIHDNSPRPPSVLVSQLRDHIAACWRLPANDQADQLLTALTTEHRLQPFNPDYFAGPDAKLFSYAHEWQPAPPLPTAEEADALPAFQFDAPIQLAQLSGFLQDPVKCFMRERLGVYYEQTELTSEEQEPFAIDALSQWFLQDELIQTRLDAREQGQDQQEQMAAVQRQLQSFRRQGLLPIGVLAEISQNELAEPLEQLFALYDQARQDWPDALPEQNIEFSHLYQGQILKVQGRLGQYFGNGEQRCRIEINSSNLIDKKQYRRDKLIPAWLRHLAGHLDGNSLTTIVIGKNGQAVLSPLKPEQARGYMIALLEAYAEGLSSPLPLASKTGFVWLHKQGEVYHGPLADCPSQNAVSAAAKNYQGDEFSTGELSYNAYLQRVYPSFEQLWSQGQFSHWAQRLLSPMLSRIGAQANQED